MIFAQILSGASKNFAYILGDEETGEAVVIDPGDNVDKILERTRLLRANLKYILNTHSHRDHASGNERMKKMTGAKIVMHAQAPLVKDMAAKDRDCLDVGKLPIDVLHTPGHTPDSICFLVENKLFTGDTLFVGECGRTDLPGGSAEDMYHSLFEKILPLDDSTEVYPGHDYGERASSTIGLEKKTNYTLKPRSLEEFIEFMKEP